MKRYGKIQNVELASKNTVYPVVLPYGTRSYTLKTRGNTEFKIGFSVDAEGDLVNYITIPSGSAESENDIFSEADITLYVQGEKDAEVLEVKYWMG